MSIYCILVFYLHKYSDQSKVKGITVQWFNHAVQSESTQFCMTTVFAQQECVLWMLLIATLHLQ